MYIYPIYIYSYRWILLILSVETGNLIVFYSMRNPKSAIQHILDDKDTPMMPVVWSQSFTV